MMSHAWQGGYGGDRGRDVVAGRLDGDVFVLVKVDARVALVTEKLLLKSRIARQRESAWLMFAMRRLR